MHHVSAGHSTLYAVEGTASGIIWDWASTAWIRRVVAVSAYGRTPDGGADVELHVRCICNDFEKASSLGTTRLELEAGGGGGDIRRVREDVHAGGEVLFGGAGRAHERGERQRVPGARPHH